MTDLKLKINLPVTTNFFCINLDTCDFTEYFDP